MKPAEAGVDAVGVLLEPVRGALDQLARGTDLVRVTGLFKGNEHARHVWDKPEARQLLSSIADEKDLVLGAVLIFGTQSFVFKAPVTKLAEIAKKRIRVLASEVEQAAIQSLGASSIPMTLPEILPGLQQGTIDGVSSGIGIYTPFRYYDTAPYILDTHLSQFASIMFYSKEWFKGLPADLQKIVLDTSRKIEPEMFTWVTAKTVADTEGWTKNGGKIAFLSADEQAEAERRVGEATQAFLAKYPKLKDTYDKLKAITTATP